MHLGIKAPEIAQITIKGIHMLGKRIVYISKKQKVALSLYVRVILFNTYRHRRSVTIIELKNLQLITEAYNQKHISCTNH